jgi:hypothetical protein
VGVLDIALLSYPHYATLLESRKVLHEVVSSVKVADLMEKAEKASFKGNEKRALSLYQDALFLITREDPVANDDTIQRLNDEIAKLRSRLPGS